MQFNLKISREIIQLLSNKKLSIDQLFFLELIQKEKTDFLSKLLDNTKYKQYVIHDLLNKKMITLEDSEFKLTTDSKELLSLYDFFSSDDSGFVSTEEPEINMVKPKNISDDFEENFNELWNLYPLTDKWEMDGVYKSNYFKHTHNHSRTLKTAKLKIKEKYKSLLKDKNNKLTHQDVINSLKFELWFRKHNSTNVKNGLSFMQNILTWINQKSFESYFELYQDYIKEHGSIDYENFAFRGKEVTIGSTSTRLI